MMTTLILLPALVASAEANERVFTYTYDTATLPRGAREIEPWTTVSFKDGISMKQRMELERGVSDRLLTAFYLNWEADASGSTFQGVSSEWKLGLKSRSVDPVGLALYGEVGVGPTEEELEFKLLLDRQQGDLLLAANLVAELEWEAEITGSQTEWEAEQVGELVLAAAYKPGTWSIGAEFIEKNELALGELKEIVVGAGPALSTAGEGGWAALTAMAWLVEVVPGQEAEVEPALQLRLLMGFDF